MPHSETPSCLFRPASVRGTSAFVACACALLLSSCSTSFHLDRALEAGSSDWLQHGGDAGRRHVSALALRDRTDSVDVTVVWEFSLDGMSARAAPLLVDGAVIFSSTTGMAEAVDLRSGTRIGRFPCTWFIHGTPAIADGCLFIATSGIEPLLLCFDLRARAMRYETRIPSVHASLCAVDGGVIVAARSGEVSRYASRDSIAVWSVSLDGVITAAPAASDSMVIVAAQNGDLSGLSLRDGTRCWRLPTTSAFLADPSVANGLVVAVNAAGTMVAVDLHQGTERWRRDFGDAVYYGTARRGDTIAVALAGGDVVLLREDDGAELARWRTDELPGASPLFSGAVLLQLLRRGELRAIDLATGAMRTVRRLDARSTSAPLLTGEGVVLVDEEGDAVCVRMMRK
ncbi:MAG: PQQ-binding-like beta-propeller repeat protein [Bacteroidota bacterium]|nr:PQQ-binding-like beta-propeller repeat protein [Bacteroidota bacterium]